MKRIINYMIFAFLLCPLVLSAQDTKEQWLQRLDESLSKREQYENQKKSRLDDLRKQLKSANSQTSRYQALMALFEENKSYSYDSAVYYARESHKTKNA